MNKGTTDLTNCDREPVAFIASVQPAGAFLAFKPEDMRITNASENAPAHFETTSAADLIGKRLAQVLSPDLLGVVQRELKAPLPGGNFFSHAGHDCYLYRSDGLACLELEEQVGEVNAVDVSRRLRDSIRSISEKPDYIAAATALASGIREISGMDRVMIYRFMPKLWHGEVIAESRIASSAAFLGHRFPASDIPRPARDLYLRNRLRFIKDSKALPTPIVPNSNPVTGKTIDLSDSRLRGVSTIHLEYLRNMGVASSFSVAIIVGGQLWGLVACHSFETVTLPAFLREACESLTNAFAARVSADERLAERDDQIRLHAGLRNLIASLRDSNEPVRDFLTKHNTVGEIFRSQGLALIQGEQIELAGLTPLPNDVRAIHELALARMDETNRRSWSTSSLASIKSEWGLFRQTASGVMAARLPGATPATLMLFRPELLQTIVWGGDPRKSLNRRDYQGTINPRASFESWSETIEATANEWHEEDERTLIFLVDIVFQTFLEKEHLLAEILQRRNK